MLVISLRNATVNHVISINTGLFFNAIHNFIKGVDDETSA